MPVGSRAGWRLSNALPVATQDWARHQVGPFEYVVPLGHPFDVESARRAAAFADSVATRFGLVLDGPVEYYVARTASEMARISGLDYSWDPNDGRAYPENGQVFVGTGREDYLHEIVHALFGPTEAAPVLSEGLATYLGGIGDEPFESVAASLAGTLRSEPGLRLDDVLRGRAPDARTFYGTGAVLVAAALEAGGPDAVHRLLDLGTTPEGVYDGLRDVLGVDREAADAYWRRRVLSYDGG